MRIGARAALIFAPLCGGIALLATLDLGIAAIAMLGGGVASLQALTISVGLPFGLVLLIMCVGLLKGLREERASRKKKA